MTGNLAALCDRLSSKKMRAFRLAMGGGAVVNPVPDKPISIAYLAAKLDVAEADLRQMLEAAGCTLMPDMTMDRAALYSAMGRFQVCANRQIAPDRLPPTSAVLPAG